MAGLSNAGFVAATQAEVESDLRAEVAAATALGANVNTDAESPLGQILVITAAALAELWGEAENIHTAASLLTASGTALDNLATNYGLARHPAESSTVLVALTGTGGTVIPATAAITDPNGARWTITAATVLGSLGTASAAFASDSTGAIAALASTTWTIATPVTGWTGATNSADATLGRAVETDAALRARALDAARGAASSGIDGIRAAVLQVANVTECLVIENDRGWADADGRPEKSIEVVVRGGTDAAIAAAIWANKPSGIETTTTVSGGNQISQSVIDTTGASRTVKGSRPDLVNVYVEVDYTPLPSAPSTVATTIQMAILDFGEALTLADAGVYPPNLEAAIYRSFTGNVFSFFELRMGLSASPGSAVAVPTSLTELADFDSSRITITQV